METVEGSTKETLLMLAVNRVLFGPTPEQLKRLSSTRDGSSALRRFVVNAVAVAVSLQRWHGGATTGDGGIAVVEDGGGGGVVEGDALGAGIGDHESICKSRTYHPAAGRSGPLSR
ncbi:hypothetical protein EJB05_30113, partial [Eragrostis curvula]